MSYATVLAGLDERFRTISGLKAILDYEPTAIHDYPTLYSLLDSFEIERRGQVVVWKYRILHRLVFRWQDNAGCELELVWFVNAIPAAVDADPQLGGRITSGLATIAEGDAGWAVIGGTDCRVLDFYSTVVEK